MENKILMQEEIDALLKDDEGLLDLVDKSSSQGISLNEADVLGEIGNISMGSAATTLSQLLNHKVLITSPQVKVCTQEELFGSFNIPYMAIEVDFTEGLEGLNLLTMKVQDASIIADMMMGGDGTNVKVQLSEFELSAAAEAMNQMIGSAATSMAQMFSTSINITPPRASVIEANTKEYRPFGDNATITIVAFRMTIGDLVDTEIMQIMDVDIAKKQAAMLIGDAPMVKDDDEKNMAPMVVEPHADINDIKKSQSLKSQALDNEPHSKNFTELDKKYELILDIPLKVSVVLGKSKKNIGEVLRLMPGAIVELDKVLDEDVDILVNGTLVAKGEVVVVEENFGVRIKTIISPAERINYIR